MGVMKAMRLSTQGVSLRTMHPGHRATKVLKVSTGFWRNVIVQDDEVLLLFNLTTGYDSRAWDWGVGRSLEDPLCDLIR